MTEQLKLQADCPGATSLPRWREAASTLDEGKPSLTLARPLRSMVGDLDSLPLGFIGTFSGYLRNAQPLAIAWQILDLASHTSFVRMRWVEVWCHDYTTESRLLWTLSADPNSNMAHRQSFRILKTIWHRVPNPRACIATSPFFRFLDSSAVSLTLPTNDKHGQDGGFHSDFDPVTTRLGVSNMGV